MCSRLFLPLLLRNLVALELRRQPRAERQINLSLSVYITLPRFHDRQQNARANKWAIETVPTFLSLALVVAVVVEVVVVVVVMAIVAAVAIM